MTAYLSSLVEPTGYNVIRAALCRDAHPQEKETSDLKQEGTNQIADVKRAKYEYALCSQIIL